MPRSSFPKPSKTDPSELVSLLFAMGRVMKDRVHKSPRGTPQLSLLHLEALRYVGERAHPLMRDVAKNFHVTPPAATLLIDGLVKEKLLVRTFDSRDRRAIRIELTKRGAKLLSESMGKRMEEFRKLFKVLDEKERHELALILKKIIRNNK